jgi:DNA-binding NarL/FixJ family response regulator
VGPVTVLVAAREEGTRAACRAALADAADVRVVAEAGTARQVLAGVRRRRPRVVVLASPLASPDDRLLLGVLRGPRTPRVLVVAPRGSEDDVASTLAYGARGHLEPARVHTWLAPAVRALARGEAWCPRAVVNALVERLREREHAAPKDTTPWSNGRRARGRRR